MLQPFKDLSEALVITPSLITCKKENMSGIKN